ncbi:MAG TPA: hypothetical protein VEZ14_00720 [Dehalococcoidia bacterium]|nr:hypothetical protein [Dehalococcoidia bacterium]
MVALQRHALPFPRRIGVPKALGRLRSGKALLVVAGVMILAAATLQVNQFSLSASTGYQIDNLNTLRAAKQAENHQLEAEVAQLSSLARVDWEARVNLHMVPPTRKLYITVNQPVPQGEALPTRFLPGPTTTAGAAQQRDSIWKRLLKLLPF